MKNTLFLKANRITSSIRHASFLVAITIGSVSSVALASSPDDIPINYPQHDINPDLDIYEFADRAVEGATGRHYGYELLMDGTEDVKIITGKIDAVVGSSQVDGVPNYQSWELLRIDNMPSVETDYNWKLDAHVSITSADNPTNDPDLYSDTAYGIILHNFSAGNSKYSNIKEVAGSVTITDYQGLKVGAGTHGEVGEGTVYGVEVGAFYDVETLSSRVDITNASAAVAYQFNSGTRIGVDEHDNAIEGAGITGEITMHNVVQGVGILYSGTADHNPTATEPRIGYNSAQIRITSDEDHAVQAAVGVFVNGEGADNDIKGALTGVLDGNIDIDVYYDEKALALTDNPVVTGIQIFQKDEVEALEHVVFGDGASISAKYKVAGEAADVFHYGDSINLDASPMNKTLDITTVNDTDTVTLEGNIRAYYSDIDGTRMTQDLTFEQGIYNIAADAIEASSITLGTIDRSDPANVIMSEATLNLKDTLVIDQHVEHVDFYLRGHESGQYSSINIDTNKSLTLGSVNNINIFLGEDLLADTEYEFDIITGDVRALDGLTFTVFDGLMEGPDSLLWEFDMNADGDFFKYTSLGVVTTHYFEVDYTENGVRLIARIADTHRDTPIPEPATATLSLLALTMLLSRRRRKVIA